MFIPSLSSELYRNALITPRTNCSVPDLDCGFDCETGDEGDIAFLVKELISSSVPETMSDHGWNEWVDFICTGNILSRICNSIIDG
jgi:hypothetical protein